MSSLEDHVQPIANNGHLRNAIKKIRTSQSVSVRFERSLSQNVCSLIVIMVLALVLMSGDASDGEVIKNVSA